MKAGPQKPEQLILKRAGRHGSNIWTLLNLALGSGPLHELAYSYIQHELAYSYYSNIQIEDTCRNVIKCCTNGQFRHKNCQSGMPHSSFETARHQFGNTNHPILASKMTSHNQHGSAYWVLLMSNGNEKRRGKHLLSFFSQPIRKVKNAEVFNQRGSSKWGTQVASQIDGWTVLMFNAISCTIMNSYTTYNCHKSWQWLHKWSRILFFLLEIRFLKFKHVHSGNG